MASKDWSGARPAPIVDPKVFIGRRPNKTILVPPEFQRETLYSERMNLINEFKLTYSCDVQAHEKHDKVYRFDVYGSSQGVERVVTRINDWIYKAHKKSKHSSTWARTSAFVFDEWYEQKIDEFENARRQMFRGAAPETDDDGEPLPMATVEWPNSLVESGVTPRDVFGSKSEGLDRLRMQDEAYITLVTERNESEWSFEIKAHKKEQLATAEDHVRTLIDKVRAEQAGETHVLNMILDHREGMEIELQQCEPWWPSHKDKVVPYLVPSPMMADPGDFRLDGMHTTQVASIRHSLRLALDSVRRKQGTYDFVVRLGSLALSSKHVPVERIGMKLPKDKFIQEINGPIDLDVKKWLADDDVGYGLLRKMMLADGLLEPTRPGYYGKLPETLDKTRPFLRGTWVFRDPNTPAGQVPALLVVQIDWTEDEDGMYEKGNPKFFKLESGRAGPKKNMEVNLLELGESRGWQFALESLTPLSTQMTSPFLIGFADSVAIKPRYDMSSTESFATWATTPTVKRHLHTGRADKIYSFGIRDTYYKVELTAMWYPESRVPVWGLGLRHIEWESHFASLEGLKLGEQANWGEDAIATFFPKDGQSSNYTTDASLDLDMKGIDLNDKAPAEAHDGLDFFLAKLLQVSALVTSITTDGGIRI